MKNIIGILMVIGFWFLAKQASARTTEKASIEFDPSFNQELIEMDPNDEFLDPNSLYKCQKTNNFLRCLEHFLRKKYQAHSYTSNLIDEWAVGNEVNLEKRNPNKDELLWFIKNAIAKNQKYRPSIKTTRF
ncbi:hypothetical protein BpHYR1_025552 [Brachionus plicatilis]|uniref:Uncharacterized protein n=1 Tax=Brachionus plicatilis TaxID=10195 RepID=A0A3M7QZM2_BRAPC|nr:hypothetical protein BpHYR1_025552 [Brachionus plicatilis]